jgi:8-oxo-dGTP diphosphatase
MSSASVGVAVALLLRDGCVLMGERRPDKVYPLHWEFPGGKIEAGETALEAIKRELLEELGIEIAGAELWDSETATYSNGMTYAISYFLVRQWKEEISNLEFNRVEWISEAALPNLIHLSGNKAVLARLMREGIPR